MGRIISWDQSPCGHYSFEDYGVYVVVELPCGGDVFAQGDSADIIRQEWAHCVEAGCFRIWEEYRPEAV